MTLRRALLLGVQSPHNGHRSGPNAYSSLWGDISIPPDMTFDRYSRRWSVVGLVAAIGCATLTAAALESRAAPATGQEVTTGEPRVSMELSRGWRFRQAEGLSGIESNAFDDSSWAAIELPHTWNRLGNAGTERSPLSNTVQGVGWYRLRFRMPPSLANKRYFLQFDGVGTVADVWVNGHYLGKHPGAFSRFRFDASAAIDPSGGNLLVFKSDNSLPQPGSTTENVIPLSGDFFMFGGIYRPVTLIATDAVHADMLDYGGPGVYARALSLDSASAIVRASTRLGNDTPTPQRVTAESRIEDKAGLVVAAQSSPGSPSPAPPVQSESTL